MFNEGLAGAAVSDIIAFAKVSHFVFRLVRLMHMVSDIIFNRYEIRRFEKCDSFDIYRDFFRIIGVGP